MMVSDSPLVYSWWFIFGKMLNKKCSLTSLTKRRQRMESSFYKIVYIFQSWKASVISRKYLQCHNIALLTFYHPHPTPRNSTLLGIPLNYDKCSQNNTSNLTSCYDMVFLYQMHSFFSALILLDRSWKGFFGADHFLKISIVTQHNTNTHPWNAWHDHLLIF